MEPLYLHLRTFYKVLMVIFLPFTFGIGTVILWVTTWSWPKFVDVEGLTLRNGKRYSWKDVTLLQPVTVVNRYGGRMAGRLDIHFGKKVARIVPQSLKEGGELMDYLSKVFGKEVSIG